MGEPWSDIVAHLRGQRLLAPQSLQERLLGLADPKSVIEAATALNLSLIHILTLPTISDV